MEDGCGFFRWIDPPMCARSKTIIPGLLRKIRELERRLEVAEEEDSRYEQWGSVDDGTRMGWGFFKFLKPLCIFLSVIILFVWLVVGLS